MPNTSNTIKIEGWEQLAEVLGIVRGAGSDSVPSVALKTTASNQVQVEVKCYAPDPDKAKEDAVRIFNEVRGLYGLA